MSRKSLTSVSHRNSTANESEKSSTNNSECVDEETNRKTARFGVILQSDSKAVCNLCGTPITFKTSRRTWSTSHLLKHMRNKHKNVEIEEYRTEPTTSCIFCSKEFNSRFSISRHFTENKCGIKKFYTNEGWSLAFTSAINGEVVPTDPLLTFFNESWKVNGPFLFYYTVMYVILGVRCLRKRKHC